MTALAGGAPAREPGACLHWLACPLPRFPAALRGPPTWKTSCGSGGCSWNPIPLLMMMVRTLRAAVNPSPRGEPPTTQPSMQGGLCRAGGRVRGEGGSTRERLPALQVGHHQLHRTSAMGQNQSTLPDCEAFLKRSQKSRCFMKNELVMN